MSRTPHILVVEDDREIAMLVSRFLRNNDFRVRAVPNGREMDAALRDGRFDLIVLDVMMPKLSGFEVCERLKSDPATSPIMILMVTALGELGDIERAVNAGTDDFLSKPVNKVELVKRVENMLKLRHVTDELERLRSYISTMDDELPPRSTGRSSG